VVGEGASGISAPTVPANLSVGLSVPPLVPQPIVSPDAAAPIACDPGARIVPDTNGAGLDGFSVTTGCSEQWVRTRGQNNIKKPKVYTYGTIWYAYLTTSGEPEGVAEALHHDQWRGAKENEFHDL
jgi:hypothetical protein